jgi:hypothetical protein
MPLAAKTQQEYLAELIAEAFGESGKRELYLHHCRKYPLETIQKAFAEARSIPDDQIKKSRAAVFFYLVNYYAHHRS